MAAEPGGVAAARCEAPTPGQSIAALDRDGPPGTGQVGSPGEDAVRAAEDLAGDLRSQIGRNHRAAGILPETPGGAAVTPRQLFENRGIGQRVELGAAD